MLFPYLANHLPSTAQPWENDKLKAFPIFPSGVRYMPEKIKDKATFLILLQNFSKEIDLKLGVQVR
ncbi:hypothetical protein DVH24_019969 [Malus domestica]|uniref:Uncharacterized protein n=1 Tax=Malus domestica TaxID=3750 RepID=A0A498I6F1_MALDO|nr:hypothetical protein DVH24_019969 [Malus domestica]